MNKIISKKLIYFLLGFTVLMPIRVSATENQELNNSISKSYYHAQERREFREGLPNTWKPHLLKSSLVQKCALFVADLNVGIGFLYFSGSHGSFTPSTTGLDPFNIDRERGRDSLKHRWNYNRTPLTEGSLIWNLGAIKTNLNWLSLGITYLHQGNVFMSYTHKMSNGSLDTFGINTISAVLKLDAIGAKFYFLSPSSLLIKSISIRPYLACITGPSWQTWQNLTVFAPEGSSFNGRTVYSANCFFGSEIGIKIKSLLQTLSLTTTLGIKFNLWGRAASMFAPKQSEYRSIDGDAYSFTLIHPFRIKTVYQWSPFIGITVSY